jgi:inosine-uridine nucleoside N-ribohydrolase
MSCEEQKIDVWLDCDPGIDDTFAMILSAFSPKINILGISTVSGNSNVDYMTRNTLKILNLIGYINNDNLSITAMDKDEFNLNDCKKYGGLSIPVIQGSSYPFLGKPVSADHM